MRAPVGEEDEQHRCARRGVDLIAEEAEPFQNWRRHADRGIGSVSEFRKGIALNHDVLKL